MLFDLHWTFCVIIACAVWSMFAYWRPASIALALSWGAGQAVWFVTGEQVPIWLYIPADLAVLYMLWRYNSSRLDWLIAAGFPLAWQAYAWTDPVNQWWFLWGISVFQLILAGPWRATRTYEHSDQSRSRGQYVEAR